MYVSLHYHFTGLWSMWVLLWDKKNARVFSVPCSSIYGRVCFASFDVLATVYLTTPFSSGIVVLSLVEWFQKFRGHVMKNLNISTLEDEATTLPQNVGNLTQWRGVISRDNRILLCFVWIPTCSDKNMEEYWSNELTWENRDTRRWTCLRATSSTTNPTQTARNWSIIESAATAIT